MEELGFQKKLMNTNYSIPKLYGLPKIHNEGPLKFRPIVSNIGAPAE
jgi:hypothetical protein